ncbi:MAG TPA: protein kinase [Kofleriaceae bacterium]|nr:protein kinase [Kofleriaceae bacterium]
MSHSPPPTLPRIGPYEVFGRIADGHRSVVWAATARRHLGGFAKTVAIKCLKPAAAQLAEERQAFMFEATLAAGMDHPNLIHVFDVGVWEGRPYMVMELVKGWTLRSLLATAELTRVSIPLPAALAMIYSAAEGLHFVHGMRGRDGRRLRLVHRDVDDTNILVARAGYAKVTDFGFATPTAIEHAEPLSGRERTAMRAPELEGLRPVDCRADIYALGMILERFCDQMDLPFSDDLRAVVARAAAHKPHNRFDNARDFQHSLEAVAAARDLTIAPAAAARFLEQLFAPAQRPAPAASPPAASALPGLADARRGARRPIPNGGRTRVRVTRGKSSVTAMRSVIPKRRATTGL